MFAMAPVHAMALYRMFLQRNVFVEGLFNLCYVKDKEMEQECMTQQECYEKRVNHCVGLVKKGQKRFHDDGLCGKGIPEFAPREIQKRWDDLDDRVSIGDSKFSHLFAGERKLTKREMEGIRLPPPAPKLIGPTMADRRRAAEKRKRSKSKGCASTQSVRKRRG